MRVCMIAYTFYEGDNRVMRYAETLAQRGDYVDVIALRLVGYTEFEIVNGVHVFLIQQRIVNERRRLTYLLRILLFFLRTMILLSWRQLRVRYDLIHVHSVPDFLVFVTWLPKLLGAKVILDIHDLLPEFYASKFGASPDSLVFKLLMTTERVCAAFSDHVIIANHIWEKTLQSRSVRNGKCTAILNVPDRTIFQRRGRTRQDGKFILLFPGTLNWHQGLDIAIGALARIRDQVPQAELHVYGDGSAKPSLLALVAALGLQDRVFFFPVLPLREIVPIMQNSDLGVVPKRKDSFGNEAFSTKIMEFMALGVPVIVSDTKVDRYYFNDSIVRFFRGGDEADLAAGLLELIQNPARRQRLVRNAEEFVARNDWEANLAKYLDLVDSLTGQARKRRAS